MYRQTVDGQASCEHRGLVTEDTLRVVTCVTARQQQWHRNSSWTSLGYSALGVAIGGHVREERRGQGRTDVVDENSLVVLGVRIAYNVAAAILRGNG